MTAPHRSFRSFRRPVVAGLAAGVALSLLAAGCSSDASDGAAPSTTAARSTTTAKGAKTATTEAGDGEPTEGGSATTHPCDQGATGDLGPAARVPGSDTDWTITSFDGTELRAHWFPTDATDDERAPTVLMGPGWSLPGDTSVAAQGDVLFGALSIRAMLDKGYNVLTWDPRGFGKSQGTVEVNSPDFEGRDVQVLLDWVAAQPEARVDDTGDPRVGMVGFSYGGGIQLTTAGIDCRIDALVPGIAWHSLETSLFKHRTVKEGWASVLTGTGTQGNLDPHITSASRSGAEDGTLSAEDEAWFEARGPGDAIDQVAVPTLFVQGTVDTLFTLDEAITNQRSLLERDVPTAMLWFCGGHGVCLTDPGTTDRVSAASFAWLARYLKDDDSAPEVPGFSTVDQQGRTWTADAYPTKADREVSGSGGGALALVAASKAGPITLPAGNSDLLGTLVEPITPAPAKTAVEVPIRTAEVVGMALGAPKLELTYTGTAPAGKAPTRVFAQIVDTTTGVVVGNQITPIAVTLDGKPHTTTVDLEVIAQQLAPGSALTLQLVASTVAYATPRLGGSIAFRSIDVTVPVVTTLTELQAGG
ncbi:alpha/beta fold hydrolase [Aquihabitans sp. G128]|uniref:alpha/beta hydrolase family protein n=1 Tax=Aquihabitans sp. G128 TaxID=2849779 RepID=UPI001C2258EB|nr:alpha/beta fold hydrolase [Aquihabitans sp. G128]QXC60021.1 alpha/beta fold hydrolase [Aquihabitans sp. G128]